MLSPHMLGHLGRDRQVVALLVLHRPGEVDDGDELAVDRQRLVGHRHEVEAREPRRPKGAGGIEPVAAAAADVGHAAEGMEPG